MRILLVDDDRLVLSTVGNGLRGEGYAVEIASSGKEAIALAEQTGCDLAILDIQLPDMSGVDLARCLKQAGDTPVLFLSAFNERSTVEAALAEGGLGYLVKPVDIHQLVPAVEAALARARDLKALTEVTGQLQQALAGGRNTSTAIGILMERHLLGYDEAFQKLRSAARAKGCKIEVLASRLVDAAETLNTLSSSQK